ncbi:MAG: hypothetical protein ACI87E_003357 [Mariniblastus sp.]|jgi:hypothetical protein
MGQSMAKMILANHGIRWQVFDFWAHKKTRLQLLSKRLTDAAVNTNVLM